MKELEKRIAKKFCELFNDGDLLAFDYLKNENTQKGFLAYSEECLLYSILSMNTILNDYYWENTLEDFEKEKRPNFNDKWLLDLEDKYFDSTRKLIKCFKNIKFNDGGILEMIK